MLENSRCLRFILFSIEIFRFLIDKKSMYPVNMHREFMVGVI